MKLSLIWYGAFWKFIHRLTKKYASHLDILIYEKYPTDDTIDFCTFNEAAQGDIIIPCVPISQYEQTLIDLSEKIKSTAIIIDICTIKEHTWNVLKNLQGVQYVSTHPMFWPNSYDKKWESLEGLRLVICDHKLNNSTLFSEILEMCNSVGMDIILQSAHDHDKHLARSLFLTHYLAQILFEWAFDRTEIDTLSFWYLMDAVEIVRYNKKLFEEVFRYNTHCKDVIEQFNLSREKIESDLLEE